MRRLFITLAIAIVVIVMFLAAVIVRFEPAVAMAGCWPNNAMLAIAVASASVGCCLGVAPRGVPRTAPLAPSAWAAPLAGRDEAEPAQLVIERREHRRLGSLIVQNAQPIAAARLLRAHGERPHRGRAAEQRDELAPLHSFNHPVGERE